MTATDEHVPADRVYIFTRKLPATSSRGERVKATRSDTGATATVGWDYSILSEIEMHTHAAKRVTGGHAVNWTGETTALGYTFVIAD